MLVGFRNPLLLHFKDFIEALILSTDTEGIKKVI